MRVGLRFFLRGVHWAVGKKSLINVKKVERSEDTKNCKFASSKTNGDRMRVGLRFFLRGVHWAVGKKSLINVKKVERSEDTKNCKFASNFSVSRQQRKN